MKFITDDFLHIRMLFLMVGLMALTAGLKAQNIVYVDSSSTAVTPDGSSWSMAYTSLQDALGAASSGDSIWIAKGTYYPDDGAGITLGDRDTSFVLKEGVVILGGFNNMETTPGARKNTDKIFSMANERNLLENRVVLSGEIGTSNSADNSYNVVYGSGLSSSTVLDGVTITGGNANSSSGGSDAAGGGLYLDNSSPKILNTIFMDNTGASAGANANENGSTPVFINVLFTGNSSTFFNGGAVTNNLNSHSSFINCIFYNNSAANNTDDNKGGAMFNFNGSSPVIVNSIFWGNTADTGEQHIESPGGSYNGFTNQAQISNSIIEGGLPSNSIDDGNNLSSDPEFNDPANQDFTFSKNSPAYNAGNNAAFESGGDAEGISIDLNGNPRIFRNETVDIGAYETQFLDFEIFTVEQITEGIVPGTNDQPVLKISFELGGTGAMPELTDFTFSTTGTTTESDISEASLLLGTTDDIDQAESFGISFPNPSGTVNLGGSRSFGADTTFYMWLVYDVLTSAASGNNIDGTFHSYFYNDSLETPPETDPSGGRSIIYANNIPGYSLQLDGIDDYIAVDGVASEFSGKVDFTVEFWFKADKDDQVSTGQVALFGIHTSEGSNGPILLMGTGGTQNGLPTIFFGGFQPQQNIQIGDNRWHHAAFIQDIVENQLRLYIDGELIQSVNTSGQSLATDFQWSFGQEYDGGATSDHYKGKFDDIRIWKSVRSQAEIREYMYQSADTSDSDLAGIFKLNQGSGSSLFESVSGSYSQNSITIGTPSWNTDNRPYGAILTGNEGWRMMSSPVENTSFGSLLDTIATQGFTGADFESGTSNVYYYEEASDQFKTISNANNIPAAGSGFITYVYDDVDFDGTPDGFPKHIRSDSTENSDDISPSISFTSSGSLANDGWNLVGNPYGTSIDWDDNLGITKANLDGSIYVWSDSANAGAGDYLTWNGVTGSLNSGILTPWQGFWIKANAASPSIIFTEKARSSGGIYLKQNTVKELRFTISDGRKRNEAIVMFSEKASVEKDQLDAYELRSLNEDYLSLFTHSTGGTLLDINALPMELDQPVSIGLDLDGTNLKETLELSWNRKALPDHWQFLLKDHETGQEIDLREGSVLSISSSSKQKASDSGSKLSSQAESELSTPAHELMAPKVLKANSTSEPRFTLTIISSQAANNERLVYIPDVVELSQNYPNPFNPTTTIDYGVPEAGEVTLDVFNMLGQKVATLLNGEKKSAGRFSVQFDAGRLASGLYLYRLKAGSTVITKKLTLIK
ncbi:MAG: LamG-like jellyroll fold domain-containing protein [Gracilimonas sp.]|nr:LamG-like jellyroll fold domain-containing protein [Gracilimonas sp.]